MGAVGGGNAAGTSWAATCRRTRGDGGEVTADPDPGVAGAAAIAVVAADATDVGAAPARRIPGTGAGAGASARSCISTLPNWSRCPGVTVPSATGAPLMKVPLVEPRSLIRSEPS